MLEWVTLVTSILVLVWLVWPFVSSASKPVEPEATDGGPLHPSPGKSNR